MVFRGSSLKLMFRRNAGVRRAGIASSVGARDLTQSLYYVRRELSSTLEVFEEEAWDDWDSVDC